MTGADRYSRRPWRPRALSGDTVRGVAEMAAIPLFLHMQMLREYWPKEKKRRQISGMRHINGGGRLR